MVILQYLGLVNPKCTGLIGSGVVVHLPSFFEELDALQSQGVPGAISGPLKRLNFISMKDSTVRTDFSSPIGHNWSLTFIR